MENCNDEIINRPVSTTLLKLEWDLDKITDTYDILIVKYKDDDENKDNLKKKKDKKFMLISDPVGEYVHGDRICSIVHVKGYATYVLMKKNPGNRTGFQAYIESKDKNFECDYVSPRELYENEPYGEKNLFNLFLYGVNRSEIDEYRYNNLTGALYVTFKSWIFKTKLQAYQLYGDITLDNGHKICLKIFTKQMVKISSFKKDEKDEKDKKDEINKLYKIPNFVVDEPFTIKRTFNNKPSNFVLKKTESMSRAKAFYQDLSKKDKFSMSKVKVLDRTIRDLNDAYPGILKVSIDPMTILKNIVPEKDMYKTFMEELQEYINKTEFAIVDMDKDEQTSKVCEFLKKQLHNRFNIEADIIKDVDKNRFNFCVIHNEEHCKGKNDYHRVYKDCIVQHVTVESFLSGDDEDEEPSAADALFKAVIKELFSKKGLRSNKDVIGKWEERGHSEDYTFIRRVKINDEFRLFKLVMHTDGTMEHGEILDNDPLFDVCGRIWRPDKWSPKDHAVVKGTNVCTIANSGIIPITKIEIVEKAMELVGRGHGHGGDGYGPKGRHTLANAMYMILDIKTLSYEDKMLYLCGYSSKNMEQNTEKAPNIRVVYCEEGENFFDDLVEEMKVPFVRLGRSTVYPYPFMYLNLIVDEYKHEHKKDAKL